MREKLQRFMYGRYGFDELSKVHLIVVIVCMVVSMFLDSSLLYIVSLALLVYCYYRAFSRNIAKRQQEVQVFRNIRYKQRVKWNNFKLHQQQKKTHRFFKCPQCKQKVRVPKGKGKICITCPKCRTEFIKKS